MKKRLFAALITLAAVVVFKLWPQADAATEIGPPVSPVPVVAAAGAIPEIEPIRADLSSPGSGSFDRDLFRYLDPPARRVETPPVAVAFAAPQPVVVEPPHVEVAPQPRIPTFPYRYIGRFGPDSAPFAVFRGDEAVINARVGQVIDGTFVVRAIGMESVSLALASDAARAEVVRVALTQ